MNLPDDGWIIRAKTSAPSVRVGGVIHDCIGEEKIRFARSFAGMRQSDRVADFVAKHFRKCRERLHRDVRVLQHDVAAQPAMIFHTRHIAARAPPGAAQQ